MVSCQTTGWRRSGGPRFGFGRSYRPRAPESVAHEMRVLKERYRPDQQMAHAKARLSARL